MKNKFVLLAIILFTYSVLHSQSIVNTRHNLSVSSPGTIKSSSESEICIFCHTPHNSSPRAPLWNRNDPGLNYTLYTSSTTQATIGQPTGASLLCLSCHDGTIALGNVISRTNTIVMSGGVTTMPSGNMNLTKNLSNDHPVSFAFTTALAALDRQLIDPTTLTGPVTLENGQMQCTSCHDPHINLTEKFLVATNQNSTLCGYCHQVNSWNTSSHKLSVANWNGSGTNPWLHTPYTNVAENGCENCHNPHNAQHPSRIMNYQAEENNCLICHNGNVATKNIQTEITKTYRHNVTGFLNVHDPNENNIVQTRHDECEDCHNPHSTKKLAATAPNANGFIFGVKGVNSNGNPVDQIQNQYELCYRCHADSPDKPGNAVSRVIVQNNTRLEFDLGNPSYHPVEGPGKNTNVPSLISPLSISSTIYCTDCHASNGTNAPAGPHGSIYPHILKLQYVTTDNTAESAQNYALCYSCHNRNTIINSTSNFGEDVHRKHIVEERTPCSVCHDAHGINSSQGNSINNSNLINFDINIVSGTRRFEDRGNFSGACFLSCHGESHNPKSY